MIRIVYFETGQVSKLNNINTFKMKLKLYIFSENEDLNQFLCLKEQNECVKDNDNLIKYRQNQVNTRVI